MTKNRKKHRNYLNECKKELEVALESGDKKRIALAHAYLGYAEIQMKKTKEGKCYG